MTPRFPSSARDILALFERRGAEAVDVPVIQPADPFLDMAGEDLRRRIFLTESETGESLCLRPEFTIPVCRMHIEAAEAGHRRYAYLGEVFRQRREGGNEFFQAGIEDLGDTDTNSADARSLADALALVTMLMPAQALTVSMGDQAVFEAVLASLGLPRGWQQRLARAFGAPDQMAAALEALSSGSGQKTELDDTMAALVARDDRAALEARIAARMTETGISPSAGRSPAEIAGRLIDKARLASVRLAPEAIAALQDFLSISAPLADASSTLQGFAARAGLKIDAALAAFDARVAAIANAGLDLGFIRYDAAFGRPLDYYTGLVFEVHAPGQERPVAGGGRYDRLLTLLGAPAPISGVGFSVWLDRTEQAREI